MIMSTRTPDVNGITEMGKPLLVAACEKGATAEKICLMLIERGADINAIDKVLRTLNLLFYHCRYVSVQTTGQTALHAACASGLVKVVRELLQRKANVNARDTQQQTPAHVAVTSKTFDV